MKRNICILLGILLVGSVVSANTVQTGIVKTKGRLNADGTVTAGVRIQNAYIIVIISSSSELERHILSQDKN